MSKELIVSATRHETRVAVLEDDQVVEIFHQREKEYSLAGSIHKGRVTRVLPGMQSAFVDIGLERDAFLYVSDFFEDNDEYDRVVSTVEEKVLRLEKEGSPSQPSAVAGEQAEISAPVILTAPAQEPRRDDRPPREDRGGNRDGNRDNRGGRGRRRGRRGGSGPGGGMPESKFYSPRQSLEETPTPSETSVATELAAPEFEDTPTGLTEELVVLPGESLAKYSEEPREEIHRAHHAPEPDAKAVVAAIHEEAYREPEPEQVTRPVTAAEPIWLKPVELAEVETSLPIPEDAVPQPSASPHEASPSSNAVSIEEISLESASPVDLDAEDEEPSDEPLSEALGGERDAERIEGEELVAEGLVEGAPAEGDEGPEPARIPTSLTATLRDQNQRSQHRVSRRSRRKMRTGDDRRPEQQGGAAAPVREARTGDNRADFRRDASEPRGEARPDSREEARAARPPLPSISDLLREGQEIVVQIAKEPLGQKGARITSHVALPGRFLVYMPSVDHVGVSRKIPSDEERQRLKRILQTHRVGIPGGYIVRTAGDGKTEEELRADMMFLYNQWMDMRQRVEKKQAPQLMHHDLDVVQRILRDQLTSAFKTVWVDNEELYESVLSFVQRFQPAMVGRVKLYTRPTPIFDEFNVTSELEKALRPKVWLKSGGYIVINQTEALVAIDINTGKYVGKSNRLEDTIVKTNTDAIKEIVRQIRLRDLGGIIVVDFIDMDERKNRQKVMVALEEAMRADRAPYKILQFNDFGLVAITRKRVKQSLERTLCAPCPYCEGAGSVKSVQTVITEILGEAHKLAKVVDGDNVMLRVHPEVAKVLKSNTNDFLQEIEETLGKTVIVKSDPLLHQTKFDLI
jgi:ribonuclease G